MLRSLLSLVVALVLVTGGSSAYAQLAGASSPYFSGYQLDGVSGQLVATYLKPGDANSTDTVNGDSNGYHLLNSDIVLVFAGSYWTTADGSQKQIQIELDTIRLVDSGYFKGLTCYGWGSTSGVKFASVQSAVPSTYSLGNVNAIVAQVVAKYPNPAGAANIFMVMMPPGTSPGSFNVAGGITTIKLTSGGHWNSSGSFSNGQGGLNNNQVGYVANDTIPNMESTLSHELVETITDPEPTHTDIFGVPDRINWTLDRSFSGSTFLGLGGEREIADGAEGIQDLVSTDTVSPYWIKSVGANAIPYGPIQNLAGNAMGSYFNPNDATIHLFYLDSASHIRELFWGGSSWSVRDLMREVNTVGKEPVANAATPLAVFWDSAHNNGELYYIGKDGDIYEFYFYPPNNAFGMANAWYVGNVSANARSAGYSAPPVETGLASNLALSTYYDASRGTVHVIYRGGGNLVDLFYVWFGAVTTWQSQVVTGTDGSTGPDSIPTQLSSMYDGTGHIFGIGADGHVMEYKYTGVPLPMSNTLYAGISWSDNARLSSLVYLPGCDAIATTFDSWGAEHVYYITTQRRIMELTRVGNNYSAEDITPASYVGTTALPAVQFASPVQISLGSTPTMLAAYNDESGGAHVIYSGMDGHLHHLIRTFATAASTPNGPSYQDSWGNPQDLSILANTTPVLNSRCLTTCLMSFGSTVDPAPKDMIFFIEKDYSGATGAWSGDVGLIYSDGGGPWIGNVVFNSPNVKARSSLAVP